MKGVHRTIPFHQIPSTKHSHQKYYSLNQDHVKTILDINKALHHGHRRACSNKTRFTNKDAALRSIRKYKQYHTEDKGAYLCPYCGHWHIGSDRDPRDPATLPLIIDYPVIQQLCVKQGLKGVLEDTLEKMIHWRE